MRSYQQTVGVELGQVNHQPWAFCELAWGNLWARLRCDRAVNHVPGIIWKSFNVYGTPVKGEL